MAQSELLRKILSSLEEITHSVLAYCARILDARHNTVTQLYSLGYLLREYQSFESLSVCQIGCEDKSFKLEIPSIAIGSVMCHSTANRWRKESFKSFK